MANRRPQFVDLGIFKIEYWQRLPASLTKHLSLELVFSEIMGVIKGSASGSTDLEPLDREQYLSTSCRLAPTFTDTHIRGRVYDIYECYESRKAMLGDRDGVDRVTSFLSTIRRDEALKELIQGFWDEVYVDGMCGLPCCGWV